MQAYDRWRQCATLDPDLIRELSTIEGDAEAINDRFYRDLAFGTGGLRGEIGAGSNRVNVYTVGKVTQGYAAYLLAQKRAPRVAIAYDSRIKSDLFARRAAEVFAQNGISVHIFRQLMPTPALSFAVRHLGCDGGIVVTASHNPAQYNGYKVYGADGCQITTEAAAAIYEKIEAVDPFAVEAASFEAALQAGRIAYIDSETEEAYLRAVLSQSVLGADVPRDVSIAYTPLNGAGISCVPECLRRAGFSNITIPDAQKNPDGNFPTCPYPNPEIREALAVGLAWATGHESDLLLATDPDCDRVGIAVKDADGGYTLLSGNQVGVLLLDFLCRMRSEQGTLPENPVVVKTIVTTPMADAVAAQWGASVINVLTGFKFIGEQIGMLEQKGEEGRYVFGFEESYGYLSGAYVRDKDAVDGSLLICELFAYHRARGETLVDAMQALYARYGAYQEALRTYTFAGEQGLHAMQALMASLRENPPTEIADLPVERMADYGRGMIVDGGGTTPTNLPLSDVLAFHLAKRCSVVIRPSGTEPKIKMYFFAVGDDTAQSVARIEAMESACAAWVRVDA